MTTPAYESDPTVKAARERLEANFAFRPQRVRADVQRDLDALCAAVAAAADDEVRGSVERTLSKTIIEPLRKELAELKATAAVPAREPAGAWKADAKVKAKRLAIITAVRELVRLATVSDGHVKIDTDHVTGEWAELDALCDVVASLSAPVPPPAREPDAWGVESQGDLIDVALTKHGAAERLKDADSYVANRPHALVPLYRAPLPRAAEPTP